MALTSSETAPPISASRKRSETPPSGTWTVASRSADTPASVTELGSAADQQRRAHGQHDEDRDLPSTGADPAHQQIGEDDPDRDAEGELGGQAPKLTEARARDDDRRNRREQGRRMAPDELGEVSGERGRDGRLQHRATPSATAAGGWRTRHGRGRPPHAGDPPGALGVGHPSHATPHRSRRTASEAGFACRCLRGSDSRIGRCGRLRRGCRPPARGRVVPPASVASADSSRGSPRLRRAAIAPGLGSERGARPGRDARSPTASTGRFWSAASIPRRAPRTATRGTCVHERLIEPDLEPRPTARGTRVIEALGARTTPALT
jgi:hypothetical protein